jgi:hypothetical protein
MSKPQTYRKVDIPRNFDQWGTDAQINYLCNAMDRDQIADFLREVHGLDEREEPTFLKDELAEIAVDKVSGHE